SGSVARGSKAVAWAPGVLWLMSKLRAPPRWRSGGRSWDTHVYLERGPVGRGDTGEVVDLVAPGATARDREPLVGVERADRRHRRTDEAKEAAHDVAERRESGAQARSEVGAQRIDACRQHEIDPVRDQVRVDLFAEVRHVLIVVWLAV